MGDDGVTALAIEDGADEVVVALEAQLLLLRPRILAMVQGNEYAADVILNAAVGRAFVRGSIRVVEKQTGQAPPYNVVASMLQSAGATGGPLQAELRREMAKRAETAQA